MSPPRPCVRDKFARSEDSRNSAVDKLEAYPTSSWKLTPFNDVEFFYQDLVKTGRIRHIMAVFGECTSISEAFAIRGDVAEWSKAPDC